MNMQKMRNFALIVAATLKSLNHPAVKKAANAVGKTVKVPFVVVSGNVTEVRSYISGEDYDRLFKKARVMRVVMQEHTITVFRDGEACVYYPRLVNQQVPIRHPQGDDNEIPE